MQKKSVLFIGHVWPEPTSSAAGYRTLALLKALLKASVNDPSKSNSQTGRTEAQWQLHFACAADKTEFCFDLEQLGINSHHIKLNDSTFDHFIADLKPELVFYDRFITEEQYAPRVREHCPDTINILDTQDLHFLRRARQKALKSGQPIILQSEDAVREVAAILRCDLSLIISSYEMQLLIKDFKIDPELLHYCPFMLTLDKEENHQGAISGSVLTFEHAYELSYEQREHYVMIGNFLHPPNWDSVLWCYQAIWPRIRQQLPQVQMHVYGAYPSHKVWKLHQPDQGFLIKGRAHNAIKTLGQYRINLAPLRFGAGLKGKIADGFIAQTPCVTTPIGSEGMADNLPWGGLIAAPNNEQQIAQHAIDLYQDPSLWTQCSRQGYHIVQQLFNETQHADALLKRLHILCDTFVEHRSNNFYGQILRHHLNRSQYFMSKWIEEKNNK